MENLGILDETAHLRLIQALPQVTARAGVPKHYIITSMKGNATQKDITWVTGFPRVKDSGKAGYVVQGENVDTRCFYIAGALLRNYIDAVVVPLTQITESDLNVDPTVLIIPNFYSNVGEAKAPPAWKLQQLYDLLMGRLSSGKQTILGVSSIDGLTNSYGNLLSSHVQANYFGVQK